MKTLEAHELALDKVFGGDYSFTIPTYQRPYAWKTDQTLQLLDDLKDSLTLSADEPYFLGSIVLVRQEGPIAVDVIDGQQRLTTLTILFSVLRSISTDSDVVGAVDDLLRERGNPLSGKAAQPRLQVRPRDSTFFRDHVQNGGGIAKLLALKPGAGATDAQRNVVANATALHRELTSWPEEQRFQLLTRMVQHTYLVVVSTGDLTSAYRIFSVMNARGMPLSPSDIFKSEVIGKLPDAEADAYGTKWDDADELLGSDAFSELFLHIRMIFAKERARKNLLREFPEQVLQQFLPDRAREFVDEVLVPYADADSQLRNRNYQASTGADVVNAWSARLASLDNNDWRPPALWMLQHHRDDPELLASMLQRLERLAASMLIRRVYSTPRASRYADLVKQLELGQGVGADAFNLNEVEKADTLARLGGEVYLETPIRKYVLLRLDEALAGSSGVVYNHPILTVEHVLPQHPKQGSTWRADFTDEQRAHWTHRLANLLLLNRQKNSAASNQDFAAKKTGYFTGRNGVANFAVTAQVLHEPVWTPEVLDRRQALLLAELSVVWDLA